MAVLAEFNERVDERGRVFSPLIERGSTNVPRQVPLPNLEDLKGFNTKDPRDIEQMSNLLGRYGFPAPDEMIEQQAQYLQGFSISPGDPRYAVEMERLRTTQSGKVLLAQSRRTQEQYTTLKAIDGDTNQECIRLAEGDEPCETCDPLDGVIKIYKEFVAADELPGGSSCQGRDFCLCSLFPVV